MEKLFKPVQEKHDGKGRPVFVCEDANGQYVYKPQTGFRSKHWSQGSDELAACFERQIGCTQNNPFYEDWDRPADGEEYPTLADEA